jgi:TolB-like protein
MSGDPVQEYFVDGMVEDIITGLSRIKWLFVIARNSTFVYKGRAVDVRQVGRELGVRYVLEGSVRKLGNRVRITSQLIDATNAAHVWAERYDRALGNIFELQDELTVSVVGAIEPNLQQAEIERAKRKRPDSLDAYDLYLRALPFAFTAMPEFMDQALPLLQQAVAIEPDYALAHAYIAWCNEIRHLRGGLHDETRAAGLRHARLAVATGGDDATALAVAGFVIGILEQDYQAAFNAFDRAMALSPSSAQAFGFSSCIRAWAGDSATSVEHAETAIRLSPFDPLIFFPYTGLAYAHLFAGRFEEAIDAAGRAAQANLRFSIPNVLQAAAFASLGRIDEAKASAQRLLSLEPTFTVGSFVGVNFTSRERLSMLAEALRQAGLPE